MSIPNSMRVGPFLPTILVKKRYLIFYILIVWLSAIPLFIEFWVYYRFVWSSIRPIFFFIYLPLLLLPMYLTLAFSAMIWAKLILIFVNWSHSPREGVFLRHPSDKDYRYWSLRNTIKRWPFWVCHRFPFPFLDNVCFKVFNVKTKFSNSLFEGWVDTEFISFGKDVVCGQGAIIQSSVIIGNLLIIKKTIIEDDVRIGSHAIVMPGTHIGNKSVLAANSVTTVGQVLKDNWIYVGIPCKEFKRNWFFEDGLEDKLGVAEDINALLGKYEKIITKVRWTEGLTLKERKAIKRQQKEAEERRWELSKERDEEKHEDML
jgi:carbonic anhydrase/acetyltransferase-like protein (isoleucine patch superfamily)